MRLRNGKKRIADAAEAEARRKAKGALLRKEKKGAFPIHGRRFVYVADQEKGGGGGVKELLENRGRGKEIGDALVAGERTQRRGRVAHDKEGE